MYKDRQVYKGKSRNADKAVYIKEIDKFIYNRLKFYDNFLESIGHPYNDDGYDIFIPEKESEDDDLLRKVESKEGYDLIEYELRMRENRSFT